MTSSTDDRTPRGPDIAGLQAFALEDDRLPPAAFVGRQDIIADIERAAARAAAGGDAVRGRTRLVFGAPGAGKTALLHELARRWRARAADGDASVPIPVDCEPGELTSPVAFTEAVLSALFPDSSHDVATSTTTEGGGGVPGIAGLRVSRTTSVPSLVDSVQAGRTPWAAIREAIQPARLTRPVVLLVDETQNMPGDPNGDGRTRLLAETHDGRHGLPIMAVLGGLGDSKQVMARRGISRFARDAVHSLPLLEDAESGEAVERFLARHRIVGEEEAKGRWRRRIAEACNGWPQHLHNYLCGAARALADARGDLEHADLDTALTAGENWRRQYYDARLEGVSADLPAVADIVGRISEPGAPMHRIVEWCREATETAAAGSDLHARMIHDGVLQEMPGGLVTCPIPSFRRYILARA
ncbi:MAG: AAA family ATPase [Immundisolibacterales bacterium]|nr:AAA family ATPase [Immundisolibacterales bacterium]